MFKKQNNIVAVVVLSWCFSDWQCSFLNCGKNEEQYWFWMEDPKIIIHITQKKLVGSHDDVIKWKHFPRNWPFVRKIHRSPVNFPHKGQWRGALMFSLIYVWINDWANNREAGDLRRQHGHYDVIVMWFRQWLVVDWSSIPMRFSGTPLCIFRCLWSC